MQAPYYIVPDVERYRELDPDSEEARRLSRLIAVNVGDPEALRHLLGKESETLKPNECQEVTSSHSTMDTIDSFLEKFGKNIQTVGYVPEENTLQEHTDLEFRNLLKNKRFQEALQLIESQNLINPQKSIYFAHQIRFLKKLIAIDKFRKQTKG